MEVCPIFDTDTRSADISDEDAWLLDLYFCGCRNGGVDFTAGDQHACRDHAFDDGLLPNDEGAGGVDLSLDATVDADRSIKIYNPLKIDSFAEERKVFIGNILGRVFFPDGPHERSLLLVTRPTINVSRTWDMSEEALPEYDERPSLTRLVSYAVTRRVSERVARYRFQWHATGALCARDGPVVPSPMSH